MFLTQCVGFYLEAAVHAFERVYNIGPSFRGEESRSRRHLTEYWHLKMELAWANLDDIINLVEELIAYLIKYCASECQDVATMLDIRLKSEDITTPFPRISYRQAIVRLEKCGFNLEFGQSLGSDEEEIISKEFTTPFWVVGIPRSIEPFPYVIDQNDPLVTRTADLIAPEGFGELLGVAEKTHLLSELDERLKEKGKENNPKYYWLRELREFGCVPHAGFGMGVERFIRWLLKLPHVRDAIPFPRQFRRNIYP